MSQDDLFSVLNGIQQEDQLSIVNTVIGIINCSKLANDLYQKLLKEMEYRDIILEYKDLRDLGLRKGAILCIDKAIIENSPNNKICAQLNTLKGIEIFQDLLEEMLMLIDREKESRGGDKDFNSRSDSGWIILCAIINSDKIHSISTSTLQALDCAIKLNPTISAAWRLKNLALFLNGKWKETIESIETTLQIAKLDDDEIAQLLMLKAWLCYVFNDIEESLKCICEVVMMDNEETRSYKHALIFFKVIREEILKDDIEFQE
jgi:tetratricopeptide (TPR) repeat protein